MSGPSGSSGTGTGSTANVYTPSAQPTADTNYQNTLATLLSQGNSGLNLFSQPPAATNYPGANNLVQQFLTGSLTGGPATPFNTYAGGALQGATDAAGTASGLLNMGEGNATNLSGASNLGLPYASTALSNGFNPAYGSSVSALQNNPYYGQALSAAQTGARQGAAGAAGLQSAGMGILNSGFDPQSALYNSQLGRALDTANVTNSMAGVANTPYGASGAANTLDGFNTSWQNNLLSRQTQAGAAASPLLQTAPQLSASSGALPSSTYTGNIGSILSGLQAQNTGGVQGSAAYNTLLGGSGSGLAGAQNLGTGSATGAAGISSLPYQTGSGIASNALSGLGSLTNLGNNVYSLPQQTLNDLQSYLQLGQSASGLSGSLGQLGFNQLATGIGGVGSAIGGINNLTGGGITSGLGSLGGGASVGADFGGGGTGAFVSGASDVGAAASGGGGLLGALPFLGS